MVEKMLESYNKISAPEHLKARIEKTASRPQFTIKTLSALAACFALVITLSVFSLYLLRPAGISLSYNGQEITQSEISVFENTASAVAFGSKTITPTGVPLYVKADKNTKISVSGGSMQIFGENTDDLLFVGTDFTLSGNANVRWDTSGLETGYYTITLDDIKYRAYVDSQNGKITIKKS